MTIELNIFVENAAHGIENGKWYNLLSEKDREKLNNFLEDSDGCEFIITDHELTHTNKVQQDLNELIELGEYMADLSEYDRVALTAYLMNNHANIDAAITDFEEGIYMIMDGSFDEDEAVGRALIEGGIYPEGYTEDSEAAQYFNYEAYGYAKKCNDSWAAIKINDDWAVFC